MGTTFSFKHFNLLFSLTKSAVYQLWTMMNRVEMTIFMHEKLTENYETGLHAVKVIDFFLFFFFYPIFIFGV